MKRSTDLSRRPNPDITGAIQHAMAALECIARTVCGDGSSTLGALLKRNPDLIPKPLNEAVEKRGDTPLREVVIYAKAGATTGGS